MRASIVIPLFDDLRIDLFKKCLESVKNQDIDDYEVICIYDGNKCPKEIKELCEGYNFSIFGKEKTGMSETVNVGIMSSNGDVIFIVEPYSICYPNKVSSSLKQLDEPESPDILFNINYVRSSLVIRKISLCKLPYLFEQYYYPEDTRRLISIAKTRGLRMKVTESYCDCIIDDNLLEKSLTIKKRLNRIKRSNDDEKLLTCIIPFKNEKYEVERTIYSILSTSTHTNIITINDCSDDGFNYSYLRRLFPMITYIENKKSIGHGNIDLGVINSVTPYCILIDAHMRFYKDDWDIKLVEVLKDNPKSIIYGNTSIITKKNNILINEDNSNKLVHTYGAGVKLDPKDTDVFRHFWAYKSKFEDSKENIHLSSNILGACYAFSKEWYEYIGGTYGLMQYGLSEACLAVKTWLMGGKCLRIQDFIIGHIYRDTFPYKIETHSTDLNRRFLIELCIEDMETRNKYIENQSMSNQFNKKWKSNEHKLKKYIEHYSQKFVMSFQDYKDNVNSKFS